MGEEEEEMDEREVNDNYYRHFINHPRKVRSSIDINIPKGCFFYPCCYTDIIEPLMMFSEFLDDFHFIDISGFHIGRYDHYSSRRRDGSLEDYFRSNDRILEFKKIEQLCTHCMGGQHWDDSYHSYCSQDESYEQYLLKLKFEKPYSEDHGVFHFLENGGRIYPFTKYVTVTLHKACGERLLQRFGNISVFFYRNDSQGEGGSDIHWLEQPLLDLILYKLVDGGLILHDGSNLEPYSETSFLQRDNEEIKNIVYHYHNRFFTYIGRPRGVSNTWHNWMDVWKINKYPPHMQYRYQIQDITTDYPQNYSDFFNLLKNDGVAFEQ
jgi:hypothetical protein